MNIPPLPGGFAAKRIRINPPAPRESKAQLDSPPARSDTPPMDEPFDSPPLTARHGVQLDTKHVTDGDEARMIETATALLRLVDPAEKNRAVPVMGAVLLGWSAGKTAQKAGETMSRVGAELTDPHVVRSVLEALARAPQALSDAHLQSMGGRLLRAILDGCEARKDSARCEAQLVLAAFSSLDAQLAGLRPARRDALAQGLFGALDEARLLHLGRLLLLRAVRKPGYDLSALGCLARAWAVSLPRRVHRGQLDAVLERLAHAAHAEPARCGAMVQELFDALGNGALGNFDLERHRRIASGAHPHPGSTATPATPATPATELTIQFKTKDGEQESLTLKLKQVPSPAQTQATVYAFRSVLSIVGRHQDAATLSSGAFKLLLDLVFRPQEPYAPEVFPDLFTLVLQVLRSPHTPDARVEAVLDRLFDNNDALEAGLAQFLPVLGGAQMSKARWQAVIERGVAHTQQRATLGPAYESACRWLTALLQLPDCELDANPGLKLLFDELAHGFTQKLRIPTQALLDAAFLLVADSLPPLPARSLFARLVCDLPGTASRDFLVLALDRMTCAMHDQEAPLTNPARSIQDAFAPVFLDTLRAEEKGQASLAKLMGAIPRDSLRSVVSFGVVLHCLFRWPVRDIAQLRRLCTSVLDSTGGLGDMHLKRFFAAFPAPGPLPDDQLETMTHVLFKHLGGTSMPRAELDRALAHVEQFVAGSDRPTLVLPALARGLIGALGGRAIAIRTLARLASSLLGGVALQAGTAALYAFCTALGKSDAPEAAVEVLRKEIAKPAQAVGLQQPVLACVLLLSMGAPGRKFESLRPHEILGMRLAEQPLLPLTMPELSAVQMSDAIATLLPASPALTLATLEEHLDALLREGPYAFRDVRLTALFGKLPQGLSAELMRRARESLVREYEALSEPLLVETKRTRRVVVRDGPAPPQLRVLYQLLLGHALPPGQARGFIEGEIEALQACARAADFLNLISWLRLQLA